MPMFYFPCQHFDLPYFYFIAIIQRVLNKRERCCIFIASLESINNCSYLFTTFRIPYFKSSCVIFSSKETKDSIKTCHMIGMAVGEENSFESLREEIFVDQIAKGAISCIDKEGCLFRCYKDLCC